jgi:hypothetical protein
MPGGLKCRHAWRMDRTFAVLTKFCESVQNYNKKIITVDQYPLLPI